MKNTNWKHNWGWDLFFTLMIIIYQLNTVNCLLFKTYEAPGLNFPLVWDLLLCFWLLLQSRRGNAHRVQVCPAPGFTPTWRDRCGVLAWVNFHLLLCGQLAFRVELRAHVSRRWKRFVTEIFFQLLLRPISNESAKDIKKPLVTGSKELSITQGNCEDQASGLSETKPIVSISSTQLVYVVTDLDRLQEQVGEPLSQRILNVGFRVLTVWPHGV